jgi:hypothetical protein
MKKTLLTLLSLLFCAITFAQSVPQGINYQAVARDASGAVLMNQNLTIQFSIISDITTSAVSWQETHLVTTNNYGLYTAIIGQGTSTSVGSSLTFDVIDWGASNHLLKVEVDYGGGLLDMGITAFMSVPYSMNASNVDPTDELQSLSISGDTLFISSGNYIILPSSIPTLLGCTDSTATNYNALANTDDGTCIMIGCTDSNACNYVTLANIDDGSCFYNSGTIDLASNSWFLSSITSSNNSPNTYLVTFDNSTLIYTIGSSNGWSNTGTFTFCSDSLIMDSIGGNGWPGYNFSYSFLTNDFAGYYGTPSSPYFMEPLLNGCTDSTATNYNAAANTDDGSCIIPSSLAIGDTHQGGIVFYLDGNGGGLIAAPTDQSTGAQWGCYGTSISGADGTAIGTGAQNTIDIEAACTQANIAADICANLTLGGYSDWFLPSRNELNEMRLNIGQGDALGLGNVGGFVIWYYWSSTEVDSNGAWLQVFSNGYQGSYGKTSSAYVRAVRAF